MFKLEHEDACPRCGAHRLQAWNELTMEEREVARRLSASAGATEEQQRLRWCTRCWYEELNEIPRTT